MIIIFSGPSGVGKSTIINELIKHKNLYFSISHTTREKRHNEIEGEDYFFVTNEEFNNLIADNYFIEYEKYGTDYYGTGKNQFDNSSKITVLDVEVNGASKLLKENKEFVGIFIDIENDELIKRLKLRGHNKKFIEQRMNLANDQRSKINEFDFVVKNVDINTTVKNILDVIYKLEES
mgnify:CR=1 FL=1|tara:strand:+ start:3061 stop:3594 length:534 start_codon:yes stop_codon:yes gene_type:complete